MAWRTPEWTTVILLRAALPQRYLTSLVIQSEAQERDAADYGLTDEISSVLPLRLCEGYTSWQNIPFQALYLAGFPRFRIQCVAAIYNCAPFAIV